MSIWDELKKDLKEVEDSKVVKVVETLINELEHNNVVSGILPITAEVIHDVSVVEPVVVEADKVIDEVAKVADTVVADATALASPVAEATAVGVNNPATITAPPTPVVTGEVVGYPGPIVDANGVQVLIENPDGTMSLNPAATPGHVSQSQKAQAVPHAVEPEEFTPTVIPPEGA